MGCHESGVGIESNSHRAKASLLLYVSWMHSGMLEQRPSLNIELETTAIVHDSVA